MLKSGKKIRACVVRVTVQQIADFLVYLFEIKQLVPSTIKGYRSAIGRTIALLGGPDFGQDEYISLLVRSFSLRDKKKYSNSCVVRTKISERNKNDTPPPSS
jgi:hypothetical protein